MDTLHIFYLQLLHFSVAPSHNRHMTCARVSMTSEESSPPHAKRHNFSSNRSSADAQSTQSIDTWPTQPRFPTRHTNTNRATSQPVTPLVTQNGN